MVSEAQICQVLIPWLGTALTQMLSPSVRRITSRLNGYTSRQELSQLYEWLRVLLYGDVRRVTNGTFVVQVDSGDLIQMRTDDFDTLADDLMYLLFSSFPRDRDHYDILRQFALAYGSLSAYRALYTFYRSQIDPQELRVMEKVIRGFPAGRLYWFGSQNDKEGL